MSKDKVYEQICPHSKFVAETEVKNLIARHLIIFAIKTSEKRKLWKESRSKLSSASHKIYFISNEDNYQASTSPTLLCK